MESAETELITFADSLWGKKYPAAVATWENAWQRFIPFLAFPPEVRRIVPAWRANVARDERLIEELGAERDKQLASLAHQVAASGDLRLIAIARVEIVGDE